MCFSTSEPAAQMAVYGISHEVHPPQPCSKGKMLAWEAAAHQQDAAVADDDLIMDVGRAQQARLTHRAVAPDRRVRRQPCRRSPAQAPMCQAVLSRLLIGCPSCNAQPEACVQWLWYWRVVGGQCVLVLVGRTRCTYNHLYFLPLSILHTRSCCALLASLQARGTCAQRTWQRVLLSYPEYL